MDASHIPPAVIAFAAQPWWAKTLEIVGTPFAYTAIASATEAVAIKAKLTKAIGTDNLGAYPWIWPVSIPVTVLAAGAYGLYWCWKHFRIGTKQAFRAVLAATPQDGVFEDKKELERFRTEFFDVFEQRARVKYEKERGEGAWDKDKQTYDYARGAGSFAMAQVQSLLEV